MIWHLGLNLEKILLTNQILEHERRSTLLTEISFHNPWNTLITGDVLWGIFAVGDKQMKTLTELSACFGIIEAYTRAEVVAMEWPTYTMSPLPVIFFTKSIWTGRSFTPISWKLNEFCELSVKVSELRTWSPRTPVARGLGWRAFELERCLLRCQARRRSWLLPAWKLEGAICIGVVQGGSTKICTRYDAYRACPLSLYIAI